jgi:predicted nucleotidyltransferase
VFSNADIISKAWLVKEVVNLVLLPEKREVDKIFLIGSYANGTQNHRSDLDFVVQVKGGYRPGQYYTTWENMEEIQRKVGPRIHVILGTEEACKRLHEKHKDEIKNYSYKEIKQGVVHTNASIRQ